MIVRLWVLSLLALAAIVLAGCSGQINPTNLPTTTIPLPGSSGGIRFSDMTYDPKLDKVLVPANDTTRLDLINPDTHEIKEIPGFSATGGNGNLDGVTSVTSGRDMLYATDRSAQKLYVIDPATGTIITSTALMTTPDYVRYVAATQEVWVTEKALGQIEVLSLPEDKNAAPVQSTVIKVPDGPEGLVIDKLHGLAYTNRPSQGVTAVILVQTHNLISDWGNGCSSARGLALDENRRFLFIACQEGKVVMLDASNGAQLANQNYGGDLNLIGYNPDLQHIYLPSGASAILAIFGLKKSPKDPGKYIFTRLGTADTALNASCVTSDNRGNIWVCNPKGGQLLLIRDSFDASGG